MTARGACSLFGISSVDLLDLEGLQEAFHRRIIVTMAFPAHALQEVKGGQTVLISLTCDLTSPINVDDEPVCWVA